jgi:hypothetical protein
VAQVLITNPKEADRCRLALRQLNQVRIRGEAPDGIRRTLIGQVLSVVPLEGDQPRWLITIERCAPARPTLH